MANRRKFTDRMRVKFLASIAYGNTVVHTCAQLGIPPRTAYTNRETDPAFAAEWDHAWELGTQRMEQEAFRRATEGVSEPVASAGKVVAHVQKHSDQLLMFLLKGRRPEMYRDTINIEHYIRQQAIAAGVDPDVAVIEAQAILKEAKAR